MFLREIPRWYAEAEFLAALMLSCPIKEAATIVFVVVLVAVMALLLWSS